MQDSSPSVSVLPGDPPGRPYRIALLAATARAALVSLIGLAIYFILSQVMYSYLDRIHEPYPDVIYPPGHYYDARQYAYICAVGYSIPTETWPTLARSRVSWMPVYAALMCGLRRVTGISLLYAGTVVTLGAMFVVLFFGSLTLSNLGIQRPALHAWAALMAPVGAAWLYLPGVEATFLAVGMVVMWLVTLPAPKRPGWELARALAALPVGVVYGLTKPNAFSMGLPLLFAFFFLGWRRSQALGYPCGFWVFITDVVIEFLRPVFRWRTLESQPMRLDWTPIFAGAGIALGFVYWVAYTSSLSGVPFYFLQQQLVAWGPAWNVGHVGDMLRYFAQGFRPASPDTPWRYVSAWNLAANVAPLIPAASPRVPPLIRGMLPLVALFLVYSGSVHGSDRYMLSTALTAVAWGCWLAPTGSERKAEHTALRWLFLLAITLVTSYILVAYMIPVGEPRPWAIRDP